MAYVKHVNGDRTRLSNITFDDETNTFRVLSDDARVVYDFRYALEKHEVEHEYEVHLLYRNEVKNEEICQIFDKETDFRIGWAFPVAALTTNEHSYADNEHFLRTAFGAYRQLLEIIEFDEEISDEYLDKLLFLDPDTVIICLFKTFISENFESFELRDFYPDLYRHGFTVLKSNPGSQFAEDFTEKISLRRICPALIAEQFLSDVFEHLIYDTHPLARFIVLYQVVELCLDRILLKELEQLTNGIRRKDIYVREIRTRLESFESEKKRINKLFNEYRSNSGSYTLYKFDEASWDFLNSVGYQTQPDLGFPDVLYLVRNTIVHNLRAIGNHGNNALLARVNDLLSHLVCELAITYDEGNQAK